MVSVVSGKVCFNSTLVQLKGTENYNISLDVICFNSTLVQLKVICFYLLFKAGESFNSTLVQLKEKINNIQT